MNKKLHWLAAVILSLFTVAIGGVILVCVGLLLYGMAIVIAEHWLGWLEFIGVLSAIGGVFWAFGVVEEYGFPWESTDDDSKSTS